MDQQFIEKKTIQKKWEQKLFETLKDPQQYKIYKDKEKIIQYLAIFANEIAVHLKEQTIFQDFTLMNSLGLYLDDGKIQMIKIGYSPFRDGKSFIWNCCFYVTIQQELSFVEQYKVCDFTSNKRFEDEEQKEIIQRISLLSGWMQEQQDQEQRKDKNNLIMFF